MKDALSALRRELEPGTVEEHEPMVLDGCALTATLRPPDGEALARTLALLGEHGTRAVVRGGGSRLGIGNPPRGAEVVLSTERLTGILELDAEDGVVSTLGGTRLADIRGEVRARGWELPLDAPGLGATVGGVIASGAIGPRRLGFGPPRDCVLGLGVSLASGERTSCGGRVVKNVTGYDLAKLYTGSFGTLGVIESAWLRLRPIPRSTRVLIAMLPRGDDGARLGLEASRRVTASMVVLVGAGLAARIEPEPCAGLGEGRLFVAEYAGDEASVARDADWLEAELGKLGVSVELGAVAIVDAIRELQRGGLVRARLAVLPGNLERAYAALVAAGAELIVHPGLALVYALFDSATDLVAIDAAAHASDADLVFEELPLVEKATRDVFGDPGPRLPLMRALKERFDPKGTLNSGRFQGRI